MYAYIKGTLARVTPTSVVLETGGVGYDVNISLYTYGKIEGKKEALLFVQQIVREDSNTLYGFADEGEKDVFNLLVSVSGIGPNTARLVLSGMTPGAVKSAILAEDDMSFRRVKGVGPKTAKRLIVELNDKMKKSGTDESPVLPISESNTSQQEALSALITLGFQRSQVQKALRKVSGEMDAENSAEEWIKAALRELSS